MPAINGFAKAYIAEAQVVIGDPAATGEQLEGEWHRIKAEVAFDGLEIGLAFGRSALEDFDDGLSLQFVGVERTIQIGILFERARQRDGILHGEFSTRTYREVGSVHGITQ